ncbi:apolipoprotein N-acyltransferase [Nitratiruptor sp. YY08-14]|nr:apolipoprotein N-acyltransferase [Nitratiruptor sp. YY08-10]BCD64702.1 apolipoprotein N-acyltransferase [Nitratiruptor sp. YY08-14]
MFAPCCCMKDPLFQKFRGYFTITLLIKSFLTALLFSLFLFLDYFEMHSKFLASLFALMAFYLLLKQRKIFWSGFFIGIFWFWWIGLSFRYYELHWMIPIIIFFVGLVYGVIFLSGFFLADCFASFFPKFSTHLQTLLRASFLLTASYIHPFGFNWFIPEITLVSTYFAFDKLSFALLLLVLVLFIHMKKWYRYFTLLGLLLIVQSHNPAPLAPLKIDLVTTHIPQSIKWNPKYKDTIIAKNFKAIHQAIRKKYDLVVLPESAFPLFLDHEPMLLDRLLTLSHKIAIVTGALSFKNGKNYNSTYIFEKGRYTIIDKVVLVPFGEEIPLPQPFAKWINDLFFDGASDYEHAKKPHIFTLKGVAFTNAICYEATHPLIYSTPTHYIIAISNNAWFLPSYEPNLQNLIIKYYATIHKKVVYHATNIAKTEVIR